MNARVPGLPATAPARRIPERHSQQGNAYDQQACSIQDPIGCIALPGAPGTPGRVEPPGRESACWAVAVLCRRNWIATGLTWVSQPECRVLRGCGRFGQWTCGIRHDLRQGSGAMVKTWPPGAMT